MPRIILSWILLIWITCSSLSILITVTSFLSSHWLIRIETPETRRLTACPQHNKLSIVNNNIDIDSFPINFNQSDVELTQFIPPSIGPWFRCQNVCSKLSDYNENLLNWQLFDDTLYKCQLSMWGFGAKPAIANKVIWLAALISMIGCCLLGASFIFILLTLCKREICNHSVFSCTGSLLGSADLILLTSLIMWPAGWDSVTVREVCGGSVGPYSKGNCSMSWAPLTAICGIILLLISAILSIAVDKSITTQTATRQILLNEKSCVFLH
ncbi:LHFPL tetraspan subfamily member 4 protein [Schistosoma japonicum]|nr:LHFPL tetraspan subfamily member 4 protein [Schistosoma japonicum]